jgi:hypothetical protein
MRPFVRRFLMHYGIYRRYPLGLLPALRMHGALLAPDANQGANYRSGAPTRTAPTIPQRVHTMRFLNMGTGMSSGHGGRLVERLFTAPFQVRSATVQHRRMAE